jgi:hypothetical protein
MINVIIFVPKILIEDRYNGAVMGVLIAIPIGLILTYLYSKAMSNFPGQGLPEILKGTNHPFLKILHLGSIQMLWFTSGLITLLEFIDILSRFVNPEIPKILILTIYLVAICLIIQLPTQRVMYFLEIVLFLNAPLIFFIVLKTFSSDYLSWDSILEVGTHIFTRPSLRVIGAATYIFSGYTNLIIFNRVIVGRLKIWNFISIFFLGLFNLFTSFLIPIGFHGSDGAQEYLYPWISTSDSLRLVYSPIERVIFLFLMFYMSITLMSVSLTWHVSLELLKGMFKKESKTMNGMVIAGFISFSIAGVLIVNTVLLNKLTTYWLMIRLGIEILTVIIFFLWARRRAT